jgi:cell wall-associated NlpC family hydrolase
MPTINPTPAFASAAAAVARGIILAADAVGSPQAILRTALSMKGVPYVFGAEASVKNPRPAAFDCSEFVEWVCGRNGIRIVDGSTPQFYFCKRAGLEISLEQAYRTPAALLFRVGGSNRQEHVAFSQGNGRTIEAAGRAYGTLELNARGRSWNKAALIPGVRYGAVGVDTSGGRPPSLSSAEAPQVTLAEPDVAILFQLIAAIIATMKRSISQGAVGGAVTILQVRLQQLGFQLPITNRYDFATKVTVQQFQTKQGLRADGVCGPVTWARLYPTLVPNAFPDGNITNPP